MPRRIPRSVAQNFPYCMDGLHRWGKRGKAVLLKERQFANHKDQCFMKWTSNGPRPYYGENVLERHEAEWLEEENIEAETQSIGLTICMHPLVYYWRAWRFFSKSRAWRSTEKNWITELQAGACYLGGHTLAYVIVYT